MSRVGALIGAELGKMWATWIPMAFLLAIVVVSSMFVLELYSIEEVEKHLHPKNGMEVLPLLLFSSWKTLMLPAASVAFCAFWITLDSQYGMIRVTGCLPFSRVELLVGKWIALSLYVVAFALAFVLVNVAWVVACSGVAGTGTSDLIRIGRFSIELVGFLWAIAVVTTASASVRRTVGAGIVTAFLVLIVMALLTMLPHSLMPPRLVFLRYLFFPIQEFADPFGNTGRDSPFQRMYTVSDFWVVMLVTALAFTIPALLHFRRRDISE